MGIAGFVEQIIRSVVPYANRPTGGTYITQCPTAVPGTTEAGAKQLQGLVATAASPTWNGYGGMIELLGTALNNEWPGVWVEGVLIEDPRELANTATLGTFAVCVTYEAGAGVPTPANMEAEVLAVLEGAQTAPGNPIGPYSEYIPLNPPVFIPQGERIACACNSNLKSTVNAGPKCCVRLVLSHLKH